MRTNRIGATDVAVSVLGLGTAQLGDLYEPIGEAASSAIVDAAWDAGIRYFDTAPHYGLGLAERRLGAALTGRPRGEFVVSSKVGRLLVPDGDRGLRRQWDFTASGIASSLESSLERLGLDRIDIALIHDPQGRLPAAIDQAYPALAALKREGVVGAIGAGTGDLEALTAFARHTEVDVLMIAGRHPLLEQPALAEVIQACEAAGISVINAGVFNSGLLATAHPSSASRYEYTPAPPELVERATSIADRARRAGTSLPQAALEYAASDPVVASVVVGADGPEQIRETVRLVEGAPAMGELWHELESAGLLTPRSNSNGEDRRSQ